MVEEIKHLGEPEQDLLEVGSVKPLGSLPGTVFETRDALAKLLDQLDSAGIEHFSVISPVTDGEMVIAFSHAQLSQLLQENREVLLKNDWPLEPRAFAERVATEAVSTASPVFDIISLAFGGDPKEVRRQIDEILAQQWHGLGRW